MKIGNLYFCTCKSWSGYSTTIANCPHCGEGLKTLTEKLNPLSKELNTINYGRIPMDDIHPEARRIAVAWMEGWEEWMKTSIREKVKLASDIQNFAIEYSRASQEEVERLRDKAKKFDEIEAIVVSCYPENEEDFDGDLGTLGEKIASHFGYI